jgi:hypothetical protein
MSAFDLSRSTDVEFLERCRMLPVEDTKMPVH